MIYRGKREFLSAIVAVFLLGAITSCTAGVETVKSWETGAVKSVVSQSIDREMEYVKPNLEPDLQARIDGTAKGTRLSGREIVDLTIAENSGDYIDFCYTVNCNGSNDSEAVLQSARIVLPEDRYQQLREEAKNIEKALTEKGEILAKDLPESQKEAFYKDLKALVTRTVVLVAAGIVYICIPDVILWGKVSAAAAIAVAAGFVAYATMTIYEKYRFGISKTDKTKTTNDWVKEFLAVPQADFALTSVAASMAAMIADGPVVKGITILVFAASNALDTWNAMMKKYNVTL
jgi:hypothetical protein